MGMTQKDVMGREVGGGFMFGNESVTGDFIFYSSIYSLNLSFHLFIFFREYLKSTLFISSFRYIYTRIF